jgi:SAM-dependent methyltransferase
MSYNNDIERYFFANDSKPLPVFKWHHYFEIYERHFSRFRGKKPNVLEIGVGDGGSLLMWKKYFGEGAKIFGLDSRAECKSFLDRSDFDNIDIQIGDQADEQFMNYYINNSPQFDIVIDDGGHKMNQQISSFNYLYEMIADEGIYLVEDTHTSYFDNDEFNGGIGKKNTFVEFAKQFIDSLHAYHFEKASSSPLIKFRKISNSIHFYDSIILFEKRVCNKKPVATKR